MPGNLFYTVQLLSLYTRLLIYISTYVHLTGGTAAFMELSTENDWDDEGPSIHTRPEMADERRIELPGGEPVPDRWDAELPSEKLPPLGPCEE